MQPSVIEQNSIRTHCGYHILPALS